MASYPGLLRNECKGAAFFFFLFFFQMTQQLQGSGKAPQINFITNKVTLSHCIASPPTPPTTPQQATSKITIAYTYYRYRFFFFFFNGLVFHRACMAALRCRLRTTVMDYGSCRNTPKDGNNQDREGAKRRAK